MSSVIENDAKLFTRRLVQKSGSLKMAKDFLDEKLVNYTTEKNKFDFLTSLRRSIQQELVEHKKTCTQADCQYDKGSELGYFVIDQELQFLSKYFEPSNHEEQFTADEKVAMNAKLDEVLEKLNTQSMGQEIIFNEINELREHLSLDKKNWSQLLKGKLYDLAVDKGVDLVVVQLIYNTIAQSFKAGTFVLPQ